jgi:hypothetical protein
VPGGAGSGTVAHLRFRALAPGRTSLRFRDRQALDAQLLPIGPLAAEPLVVVVGPERPERERRPPPEGARG